MRVCSRSPLLVLLIILYLLLCAEGQGNKDSGQNGKSPEECCFNFFNKPISVRSITQYEETRAECPKAGVVFITKKSARICVDPGFKWVKRAINQIDLRTVEGYSGV